MATMRLVPSTINNAAGTQYITISDESNSYTNTDSTTYATVSNITQSTSNRYIYIRGFNFSDVPSNAIVNSFTVKLKAYQSGGSTNTSYRPYLCNNTTTLTGNCGVITTSSQVLSFTNVTADWDTIKGYGSNGSNFGIRINCRRNSRNTAATFYIYGAEIEVNYTIPVYHSVTVTGTNVTPSGTQSILEGSNLTIQALGYSSKPTFTDNNIDVTSQVTEMSGLSTTLIPDSNTNSGWYSVTDISKAYADATSGDYASLQLAGGATGTIYLNIENINIPSSATITSVSCSATLEYNRNNSSSGFSASCRMYTGSTAKGSSTTVVSAGGTNVSKTTFNLSVGSWTATEANNAKFYLTATNNASSTRRYIYIYGVSFNVTYEIDGVIYIYTLNNITSDHTIVVTAQVAQDKMYIKVNGSWVQAIKVYKKVNGSWVQQSDLTNVFEDGVNYKKE